MFLIEQNQKREKSEKENLEPCDEYSAATIFLKLFTLHDGIIKNNLCVLFFLFRYCSSPLNVQVIHLYYLCMFLTDQTQKRERERKKIWNLVMNIQQQPFFYRFTLHIGIIKRQSLCASFLIRCCTSPLNV